MKEIISVHKITFAVVSAVAMSICLGCGLSQRLTAPKIEKYPEINNKINDFVMTRYGQKADRKVIKGKVAVVIREDPTAQPKLDRFTSDGMFSDSSLGLFPAEMYAKNPDEVDTLVVVLCTKSRESQMLQDDSYNTRLIFFEKLECPTAVYDYKAQKLITESTFYDGGKRDSVYIKPNEDTVKAEFPKDNIRKFLDGIPREK